MDQSRVVESNDGLGQGVVLAAAPAAHREFGASFGKPFGVPDADALRRSVAVA